VNARPNFDPDEPVSLFPEAGESVLRRLLGADEEPDEDEDEDETDTP